MQWTWIALGIVALLILALIGTYNGLVARRQRATRYCLRYGAANPRSKSLGHQQALTGESC